MSGRVIGSGLLVFGLLTLALIINLTTLQSGSRMLAPVPSAQTANNANAAAGSGQSANNEGEDRNRFVLLNATPTNQTAAEVQRELTALGYRPGGTDGSVDLKTRAAIMAFEYDNGLPLTAKADAKQLERLLLGIGRQPAGVAKTAGLPVTDEARSTMRTVQQSLRQLNYDTGPANGSYNTETERAIRKFERDNHFPESGRISGRLIDGLSKRTGPGSLKLSRR